MNNEERQANERFFLNMIQATNFFIWKDTGNCYDMSSGKMKPTSIKGYIELSLIVRKPFMKLFVELPADEDWDEKRVWDIIDGISK